MTDCTPSDVGLSYLVHFDSGLHSGRNALAFQRVLQCECVDHGREHAHVISRCPVHPAGTRGQAAPDIAATDDDRDLNTTRGNPGDLLGEASDDDRVDAITSLTHHRLAGDLQKNPAVLSAGAGIIRSHHA
ncbi:hypothetical protein HRbin27_02022 [bacterium HR27]|nr:hypothetical protein HRbin27_02022 [bacterium HR27]